MTGGLTTEYRQISGIHGVAISTAEEGSRILDAGLDFVGMADHWPAMAVASVLRWEATGRRE